MNFCSGALGPKDILDSRDGNTSIRWYVEDLLVDSGAARSVVGEFFLYSDRNFLLEDWLCTSNVSRATGFNGSSTSILGEIPVSVELAGVIRQIPFLVLESHHAQPLLGLDAIASFGLVVDGEKLEVRLDEANSR